MLETELSTDIGAARTSVANGKFKTKAKARAHFGYWQTLVFQVKLLLWKRSAEVRKQRYEIAQILLPPLLFFSLIILLYAVIPLFNPDGIEQFFVPLAFWVFVLRNVVAIMHEKNNHLQEAMRMMGLLDSAYWSSYFIRYCKSTRLLNSMLV